MKTKPMKKGAKINDPSLEKVAENKLIPATSLPMELHVMELPLFLFSQYKKEIVIDPETKKPVIDEITKSDLIVPEKKMFEWVDSKNVQRNILITTSHLSGRLPRGFEQDTFIGLVMLFMRKNGPFAYDNDKQLYKIDVRKVRFTLYEVAMAMKVPPTGFYIKKIKEAIEILASTEYKSSVTGVFYDKKVQDVIKAESHVKLLDTFDFCSKKRQKDQHVIEEEDVNVVTFSDFIIENMKRGYFKYINDDIYFDIPTGITRKLYIYLEKNRYINRKSVKYIKRYYDVLSIKIPIEYEYLSHLKNKLEVPCKYLLKLGYLTDYEMLSDCIYFYFEGTRADRTADEEVDEVKSLSPDRVRSYLKLPGKDLIAELEKREIKRKDAEKLVAGMNKWDIIKYILWVDKQLWENKISSSIGGLLAFALKRKDGIVDSHTEIIEFVEAEKQKEKEHAETEKEHYDKLYRNYINKNIKEFISSQADVYAILSQEVLLNFDTNKDKLINIANISGDIEMQKRLAEFSEKREESQMYKEQLERYIKDYLVLKSYDEFVMQQSNVNE